MQQRRFAAIEAPALSYGRSRTWGGFSACELRASPGRHGGATPGEHRVIVFLTAGVEADCHCEGRGGFRTLAPYEFDVVPAGAYGAWEDRSACDMLVLRVTPKLLAAATEGLEGGAVAGSLAPRIGARDERVQRIAQAIAAELRDPTPGGRLFVDGLSVALAARLFQLSPGSAAAPALSKARLGRVIAYVEDHISEDLRLDRIAEAAGVSVSHLSVLFRRATGQTVHGFVMERRVRRAQALLRAGIPITRVAHEAGFSHPSHLARWMRRVLGATPSDFRDERLRG